MKYKTFCKLKRCVGVVAAAAVIAAFPYSSVLADDAPSVDDIEQQIAQIEQENEDRRNQLDAIEGEIGQTQDELDNVSGLLQNQKELVDYYNNLVYYKEIEIGDTETEIASLDEQITTVEGQIADAEKQVEKLEEENAANLEKFAEMVRAMYTHSDTDLFSILAGSDDFYEMSVGTEVLNNITEKNIEFMNKLKDDIDKLEQYKKELGDKKQQLSDTQNEYIAKKDQLTQERDELAGLEDDSRAAVDSYQQDYDNYQSAIQQLEQQQSDISYLINVSDEEIAALEEEVKQLILAQQKPPETELQDGMDWMWPLTTNFHMITCYYGDDPDMNRFHRGMDIGDGGIYGSTVYSTKGGTVIIANGSYGWNGGYGEYVVVDHGGGYTSLYAHMSAVYVSEGQEVAQGEALGAVGDTGWATGPHLHFEIRINGEATDPLAYVSVP